MHSMWNKNNLLLWFKWNFFFEIPNISSEEGSPNNENIVNNVSFLLKVYMLLIF